jgi:hypothetical protein
MMAHIKTLVLCSTERGEAVQPMTSINSYSLPTPIDTSALEPGFKVRINNEKIAEIMYRTFSIIPPFVWQKKVIAFFREEFFKTLKFDNILIDASHDEAAKIFCDLILKSPHGNKLPLIISNKTQQILERCDPHYYSVIKSYFISEDEFKTHKDAAKKVEQTQNQGVANRLFWVAKNVNFTDLERRIYWYFYAKTLKAGSPQHIDCHKLSYDDVFNDFTTTLLKVQKKDIYKAMDSLKKKRLLQTRYVNSRKIFLLTFKGPVDMLTGKL